VILQSAIVHTGAAVHTAAAETFLIVKSEVTSPSPRYRSDCTENQYRVLAAAALSLAPKKMYSSFFNS